MFRLLYDNGVYIGAIWGLDWDNGKENGNYCLGFRVWGLGFSVQGL